LAESQSQVRDAGGIDHSDQLEFDVAAAEVFKQSPPLAEQHRDELDLHLVEQPGSQAALGDVGAVQQDVLRAAALACVTAASIPLVTKVIVAAPRGGSLGTSWVGTKIGTPSWWSPDQPPAKSNVRRPAMTAPVANISSKTLALGPAGR
jgi:hypothetical protein